MKMFDKGNKYDIIRSFIEIAMKEEHKNKIAIQTLSKKLQNEVNTLLCGLNEVVCEFDEDEHSKIHLNVDLVLHNNASKMMLSKAGFKTTPRQEKKIISSHIQSPHIYNSDSYKGIKRGQHSNLLTKLTRITKYAFR